MSASETKITLQDCLRGAFAALLRDDTAERDRLCDLAQTAFVGNESVPLDTPIRIEELKQKTATAPREKDGG